MEDLIRTAILLLWVISALLMMSGRHGKPGWLMAAVATANIVFGGYLLFFATPEGAVS